MSILVIDDDAINQDVVRAILNNMRYKSLNAPNGADGLRMLAESSDIKAILLDWNMPEMDGMAVLEKIRKSKFKTIPVIMMTAEDTAAKVKHALEHGADDYIVKPFNDETLTNKLHSVLTGTSYRRDKNT